MSGLTPRRRSSGRTSPALPSSATETALRSFVDAFDDRERVVEVLRLHVDIAGAEPELDARRAALDREQRSAGHGRREGLRAAHAAEAGGENPSSAKVAAIVPAPHLDEGLVGALHDALRADIDPRARGHLPVHHEPLAIELVEAIPGRPVRHEIGVGDEHARRVGVGAEHADRLAGLDEQRLIALEAAQGRDDAVERRPVARRPPDAAVDDELARPLGDVGVEIVHEHAHRRFGQPALGAELGSAGPANDAHIVEAGWRGHGLGPFMQLDKPSLRGAQRRSNPEIEGRTTFPGLLRHNPSGMTGVF